MGKNMTGAVLATLGLTVGQHFKIQGLRDDASFYVDENAVLRCDGVKEEMDTTLTDIICGRRTIIGAHKAIPRIGDNYWYVVKNSILYCVWRDDFIDRSRWGDANVFSSEKEAALAAPEIRERLFNVL